jgi:autotransporter-associated beta strand protein
MNGRGRLFVLAAFSIAAATVPVRAQTPTNTWTNAAATGPQLWSGAANWDVPPTAGGSATTVLQFNAVDPANYQATNDLGGPFQLNGLILNSTSTAEVTVNNAAGNSWNFVVNGTTNPTVVQNGTGAVALGTVGANDVTVSNPLAFAGSTTPTTPVALGLVTINSNIGEAGGPQTVSFLHPTTLGNSAAWRINGQNTYTGGTTLGGALLSGAQTIQLGSGSVGGPGAITSGPFGTGPITTTTTATVLVPVGADRTVANDVRLGVAVQAATAAGDVRSLTLTGSITLVNNANRNITSFMDPAATLNLDGQINLTSVGVPGFADSTQTRQLTLQGPGNMVVNGVITNGPITTANGGFRKLDAGTVRLAGANIYSGGGTSIGNATTPGGVLEVTSLANAGNNPTLTPTAVGQNTATVSDAAGLAVGQTVNNTNFPVGTTILDVTGTTLTLSNNATGTAPLIAHIGTPNALGLSPTAAGNLQFFNGTFRYVGTAPGATNRRFQLNGNFTLDASGGPGAPLSFTAGNVAFQAAAGAGARTLTLTGSNADANTLDIGLGDNSNGGAVSVLKTGAGRWALTATNAFTGGLTVDSGILQFNADAALGSTAVATTVVVNAGATLRETANNVTTPATRTIRIGPATGAGASTIEVTSAGTTGWIVNGVIANNGTGPASLVKNGIGILQLTAANTYTGNTTVAGGTLDANADAALGPAPAAVATDWLVIDNGATFRASGTYELSANRGVSVGTPGGGGSGGIGVTAGNTLTYNGVIASAAGGTGGLTKTGAGTLILGGTNTYAGPTTLNGGLVNFTSFANLGTNPAINFDGGGLQWAAGNTLDASQRTLTFNPGGATFDTNGNTVTFANSVGDGGTGGLTKAGAGTLTLAPTNNYTGPTAVSGGTLVLTGLPASNTFIAGTVAAAPAVLDASGVAGGLPITAGKTLSGHGTLVGNSTIGSGGTLAPGTSPGTLTVSNGTMTWGPNGTYVFEHDASAPPPGPVAGGPNNDLLLGAANGSILDLTGLGTAAGQQFNLVLVPTNLPAVEPTANVTYTIADFSASASMSPPIHSPGGATDLTPFFNVSGFLSGPGPGGTPTVALVNGNLIQVTFTPVPEPGFVLLAAAAAAGWWRRRRGG